MGIKDKTLCFGALSEQLKKIDLTIDAIEVKIKEMKNNLCDQTEEMEVCPDEIESQKALLEIFKNACIEDMIEQEPEGDA